jgi:hypothetical protein
MKTTLDIADDVLQAAKERAQRERKTVGELIFRTRPACADDSGRAGLR